MSGNGFIGGLSITRRGAYLGKHAFHAWVSEPGHYLPGPLTRAIGQC